MIYNPYFLSNFLLPRIPTLNEKPPTLYAILESIVNYGKEDKKKISELAKYGRTTIFDFSYPLSEKVNKAEFEEMILNHYLMRRIGFDTVTAFRIQLNAKLNEIMLVYNKMFDLIYSDDLFKEVTEKHGTDNRNTQNTSNTTNRVENSSENETIADLRNSKLPQNKLSNVKDGSYVTDYNYNKTNSTDSSETNGTSTNINQGTDDNIYNETISKTNKFELLKKFNEEIKNIYTLIFHDLDELFYSVE